jgi:hypothetical protein
MTKKQTAGLVAAATAVVLAAGAIILLPGKDKKQLTSSKASGSYVSQPVALGQDKKPASDGLNVSGASGSGLGQLTGGQSPAGGASSGNEDNSVNPATFSEYDKYKDATSAMFADIKKGDGAELTNGKTAAVYYKGWLTNGQLFDQSRSGSDGKLQPLVFKLGGGSLIPGFEQGVTGMKAGGSRLVIVPPAAGYGAQEQSGIPANSVLVFQVDLAAVQ